MEIGYVFNIHKTFINCLCTTLYLKNLRDIVKMNSIYLYYLPTKVIGDGLEVNHNCVTDCTAEAAFKVEVKGRPPFGL